MPSGKHGLLLRRHSFLLGAYDRKFEKRDVKTKGEVRPKFRSKHTKGYQQS